MGQFGKDDLKVLSELLGDKQFFFGDDPNHLDLVAFSQIALVLNVDDSENGAKCPLKEFINADCTNLVGLVTRMKDRAWGDHWDEAIGEKNGVEPSHSQARSSKRGGKGGRGCRGKMRMMTIKIVI